MKAIEFSSLPLAILFSSGLINLVLKPPPHAAGLELRSRSTDLGGAKASAGWRNERNGPFKLISYIKENGLFFLRILAGLVALIAWSLSAAFMSNDFYRFATKNHLTKELRAIGKFDGQFKKDEVVYVSDDLLANGFMASRWAAYFLKNTPLILPPPVHFGGYLFDLEHSHVINLSKVTHVLRKKLADPLEAPGLNAHRINYEIVPIPENKVFYGKGFYADEGGRRWMGQQGSLIVKGKCLQALELTILSQFEGLAGPSGLEVTLPSGRQIDVAQPIVGRVITLPLGEVSEGVVNIRALSPAVAPSQIGLGSDSRPLTFSFGPIQLVRAPVCQ